MKKIIIAILVICASMFAETVLKIEKIVDNGYGAIASGDGVQIGQSGVVSSWLNSDKKAILAKAVVVGIAGSEVKLRFEVFADIAQDSLPRYLALPKAGDEAVFGLFDNRAVVIAKNQGDYLKAIQLVNRQVIHPDMVGFKLMKARKGEPKGEDFSKFCADYSVANIYFAIDDKLYLADCGSMHVISSQSFSPSSEKGFESPFFHRLGKIETGYLGFHTESVTNYEEYYKKLLGVK